MEEYELAICVVSNILGRCEQESMEGGIWKRWVQTSFMKFSTAFAANFFRSCSGIAAVVSE
jgi:hypothetical protein